MMCLLGCQKPIGEISFPDGNLQKNSELGLLMANTLAFDGSFDNAIDNSSCLAVKLPVEVVVNGQALTVSSNEDILEVEDVLNEQPFDYDSIRISFPIEVILSDYSEIVLSDQSQLNSLRVNCVEGGFDEDIECVDFNYPLKFYVYDSENQLASTKEFQSDQSTFSFVSNLDQSKITTLAFPFQMTLADGSDQQIGSNEELSTLIESNANACDENDVQFYNNIITVPFETGQLRIELTDAPFPTQLVAEANIVIKGIDIKGADEDTVLTLSEEEFAINLLDLTNGITVSLTDIEIPEGAYSEIRMIVKESTVLLNDGTLFDLKVPGEKIKIKISPNIEIDNDVPVNLLLDFDVSRSFVVQGNPNTPAGIKGFLFKPVIKATNLATSGTLSGAVRDQVASPLEGVQISVFAADTLNTTSFTNVDGAYRILGLLPGSYEIIAELDGYISDTQTTAIVLNNNSVVDFQLVE